MIVDTTAPAVTRIYAQTANATYKAAQTISLRVEFSEAVTISDVGNLRLKLALDCCVREATYASGSPGATIAMNYLIQTGDASGDLEYADLASLYFLTSGTIKDAVGNDANLNLPAFGSGNSLAGQSAIVIDAVAPLAPVFTSPLHNETVTSPLASASGTAEPNSTVEVYKDGVSLGTTTTSGLGEWTYTTSSPFLNGSYVLGAKATDAMGNVGSTATATVTVAIPLPTANAGADVLTDETTTIFGSTTGASSRQWTKISGPGTIAFGSSTSNTTTVSASVSGSYILRFSATNANGDVVSDDMIFFWDTEAPTFLGIRFVRQESSASTRVMWIAAYDNYSDYSITYELCYSAIIGACDASFVANFTMNSSTTEKMITGLTPGTIYEFKLRAIDAAGNVTNSAAKKNGGLQFTQMALGQQHGCAVLSDQTVQCWGGNNNNSLGLGGTDDSPRTIPTTVPGLSAVKKVAAGGHTSCAILNDDSVKCWGRNDAGQTGNGGNTDQSSPVLHQSISNVQDIALGVYFGCAIIKPTGNVVCWGSNVNGVLGDGTTTNSLTAVSTGLSGASQLIAGIYHVCALLTDKSLRCWGHGARGQIGNNSTSDVSTPTTVLTDVINFEAGERFTCAIRTGGAVYCWGQSAGGNLGIAGQGTNLLVPTALPTLASGATKLVLGWNWACALLDNQTVKCWGTNEWGTMGDGSTTNVSVPTVVPGVSNVQDLWAANDSACVKFTDNRTACWGRDDYGQLGNGAVLSVPMPAVVQNVATVVKVESGYDHSCALLSDKTVKCWGGNNNSQISRPAGQGYSDASLIPGISTAEDLVAGRYHNCVLLADTSVMCWGRNAEGELGNGNTTTTATPTAVVGTSGTGTLSGVSKLIGGGTTTCGILANGDLVCWGRQGTGFLANGASGTYSNTPVAETVFSSPVKSGRFGNDHLCVLLDDIAKTVQCLGKNNTRQLGSGNTTDSLTPLSILTGALSVDTFGRVTCALLTDQTVKCWGTNDWGQMGTGNYNTYSTPQTVTGLTHATAMRTGNDSACALLVNGTVKCWGENNEDRLARPQITTDINQHSAVEVTGLTSVGSLSLGSTHACAVLQDATVKCWGNNSWSQTGLDRISYMTWSPLVPIHLPQ